MIIMKLPLFIPVLSLMITACGSGQPVNPPSAPDPTASAMPAQAASPPIENPSPAAQPGQVSDNPIPTTSQILFLTILQPLDEAVTSTGQVEVIGMAPPDTVITVNDEILIVGLEQEFKVSILLEEGPNLIEIVASDANGNETSQFLTVFYEP